MVQHFEQTKKPIAALCHGAQLLAAAKVIEGETGSFPPVQCDLREECSDAEALEIYRWFLPVLELDIHPKLVHYIKLAATLTGIGTEYVRAPRLMLEGEEKRKILTIIQEAIATRPSIPDFTKENKIKQTERV